MVATVLFIGLFLWVLLGTHVEHVLEEVSQPTPLHRIHGSADINTHRRRGEVAVVVLDQETGQAVREFEELVAPIVRLWGHQLNMVKLVEEISVEALD